VANGDRTSIVPSTRLGVRGDLHALPMFFSSEWPKVTFFGTRKVSASQQEQKVASDPCCSCEFPNGQLATDIRNYYTYVLLVRTFFGMSHRSSTTILQRNFNVAMRNCNLSATNRSIPVLLIGLYTYGFSRAPHHRRGKIFSFA
jgi:hypothetical protein